MGEETKRKKNGRSGRGGGRPRGEESANFLFKGIVGSSHGLRRAPHLSAARAPALGSGPRVLRARCFRDRGGGGRVTMVSASAPRRGADPGRARSREAPAAPGPGERLPKGGGGPAESGSPSRASLGTTVPGNEDAPGTPAHDPRCDRAPRLHSLGSLLLSA